MKTLYIWLGVLLCITIACKKEPTEITTILTGHILTRGTTTKATSQLLPIRLYDNFSSSIFAQPSRIVTTLYTDSNGYFSYTFTTDAKFKKHHLWLFSGVNQHYSANPKQFDLGGNRIVNIELIPYAWLKVKVKNNGPYFPGDKIVFGISLERVELWGPVNREVKLKGFGNGNNVLTYAVHRNNQVTLFHDTIFISAFDTAHYDLEY